MNEEDRVDEPDLGAALFQGHPKPVRQFLMAFLANLLIRFEEEDLARFLERIDKLAPDVSEREQRGP